MDKEKLLNIVQSDISILKDIHIKTDDEFVEDRVIEVITDLEYVVKLLEQ